MSKQQKNAGIQSFCSILQSSIFSQQPSLKNQLSFKLGQDEDNLHFALASFDQLNPQELQLNGKKLQDQYIFELRRSTSFEEILMENHRTVLIDSIREFFQKTKHSILKSIKSFKNITGKTTELEDKESLHQKQNQILNILSRNPNMSQIMSHRIMQRLDSNPDEMKIINDMLSICPQKIQFQVLYILAYILQECNDLIQHFKQKLLAKELKQRSVKYAQQLRSSSCLQNLFDCEDNQDVAHHFQILIEKWMITLFLMKVGIFQNELESKSIDDCLKSEIFKNIDLNDLLNQHLIRPSKKVKKQQ